MDHSESEQRAWALQWRQAGAALAEQRRRELAAMTDAEALVASDRLLSLAPRFPLSEARRCWSGLVEQQELLTRRRP